MTKKLVCNDCGGTLQKGFIFEDAGFHTPSDETFWVEGKSERNILGNIKTMGKEKYYIRAYRCEVCGLIKLYAGPNKLKKSE